MHYISCMLCSEHAETIVISLAVLHWQEFFEIFPLAVRTGMHFFPLTSLIPNMVQQELRLVYMLMIHVDLQQQGMSVVSLGVDQRAAYTGCMGYVARPHGRFLTS